MLSIKFTSNFQKLNYNLCSLWYVISLNISSSYQEFTVISISRCSCNYVYTEYVYTYGSRRVNIYYTWSEMVKNFKVDLSDTFLSNRCTTKSELLSTRTLTSEKFVPETPGEKERTKEMYHLLGKICEIRYEREKILSTYHMLVNLIGYNWYVVTSGYIENVECVILAEHGTARIRRIIYNDRCRRFVDLWFQIV